MKGTAWCHFDIKLSTSQTAKVTFSKGMRSGAFALTYKTKKRFAGCFPFSGPKRMCEIRKEMIFIYVLHDKKNNCNFFSFSDTGQSFGDKTGVSNAVERTSLQSVMQCEADR